jgi:hypothetical protein
MTSKRLAIFIVLKHSNSSDQSLTLDDSIHVPTEWQLILVRMGKI